MNAKRSRYAGVLVLSLVLGALQSRSAVAWQVDAAFEVSKAGTQFRLSLPELTEGFEYQFRAVLTNGTPEPWKKLYSRTACKCVRLIDLDGTDFDSGARHEFAIAVQPTQGAVMQEVQLFESGDSTPVMVLQVQAATRPPISFSHRSLVFDDKGCCSLRITSNDPRVVVNLKDVKCSNPKIGLELSEVPEADTLRLRNLDSGKVPRSMNAMLSVPVKIRGDDKTMWFTEEIEFLPDSLIRVSPSSIMARKSDKGSSATVMILDQRGVATAQLGKFDFRIELANEQFPVAVDVQRVTESNRTIYKLTIPPEALERNIQLGSQVAGAKVLVMADGDTLYEVPIELF